MWYKLKLWWNNPAENLWFTPALGAIFALFFSLFATFSRYIIPADIVPNISVETLSSLLDIIASSMLAVTTFSLSIMVAAFASASSSGTPRAYKLMMSDDRTRLAITSFISAFIYAVIAKIALGLEYYGIQGRFVLFISTIFVLIYLIITLIRWVQTLSQLGTLTTTIAKIETAASESLARYRLHSHFGAGHERPSTSPLFNIHSPKTGYLANLDFQSLNQLAEKNQLHFHIPHSPGKLLDPTSVIIEVHGTSLLDQEPTSEFIYTLSKQINQFFWIDHNRSFEQDPRFGLLVMSEVAQKAMSSAINDVGSAISAINALTRILIDSIPEETWTQPDYPHLSLSMFNPELLILDIFTPLVRDSASNLELQLRLLKSLSMIQNNVSEPALCQASARMAADLLHRSLHYFDFEADRLQLIHEFRQLFPQIQL